MTAAQIKELQELIGTTPDGVWGPKSIAACQQHLRLLMPFPSPWPAQRHSVLVARFGQPGEEFNLASLDVSGMDVRYEGKRVKSIRCHRYVQESLGIVLARIAAGPEAWILKHYAGCYNNRNIRGGTSKSMHAWGAAIDLWPERNGNATHWPVRAMMPFSVMEEFAREGWVPAGAFWSRDAAHFQATT